ncbi:MAG TPA: SDR family oxidoreductase [Casimicrobiaceae bacterium]|nr:SDR family oxidoreductase [Casimicrobiaceae bacterium]
MARLEDRVAIVTGAAQGIGHAIAERLLAEGARVVMGDLVEASVADAARALDPRGARTRVHAGDVAQKATADALVALAVEAFGGVDILVNNAGITHAAEFLDLEEADFDRVIAVNLKSMFLCGQAAARRMVAQRRGGAIVNLSSVNAVLAIPNQVPYVVSKGGINQLTKVMAIALAPHDIRVNAIGPGTIATELAKRAVLGSEESKRRILSRTPMGRLGEPGEVASVAAFLASDDASYLTGQTIYPDGGRLGLNYTVPVRPDA